MMTEGEWGPWQTTDSVPNVGDYVQMVFGNYHIAFKRTQEEGFFMGLENNRVRLCPEPVNIRGGWFCLRWRRKITGLKESLGTTTEEPEPTDA